MNENGFYVSADKSKLDVDMIHDFLSNHSHWATGRSRDTVEKSIQHSVCFGVYDHADRQVGFARIITDFAVYAYLLDVFILEEYRGKGLGKLLMQFIVSFEALKEVKQWTLRTKDAHGLYRKYGFSGASKPERLMERFLTPPH